MACIDLMFNEIKISGVYYSNDKKFKNQESFRDLVLKIEKLWRMQNLSITCKITVFKTLAISKIVHLALVNIIPNSIILELDKIKSNSHGKMAMLKLKRPSFVKIMKIVV